MIRPKPIHIGRIAAAILVLILIVGAWVTYEPVGQYGLGAQPENLDGNAAFSLGDVFYQITGKHKDAIFPTEYRDPNIAAVPVLNQGSKPWCIAEAAATVANTIDVGDFGYPFNYDVGQFFSLIGGTDPGGSSIVNAMAYLKSSGYPVVGAPAGTAALHKSLVYSTVNRNVTAIKAAITAYGTLAVRADWPESWFHPNSQGILPTPDTIVGGHGFVVFGWSDALGGFWMRNSWGTGWGVRGEALIRYADIWPVTSWWAVADSPVKPVDPRVAPTPIPTVVPTPTVAPTPAPTVAPTAAPTAQPFTPAPTLKPSPSLVVPSATPTLAPTPTPLVVVGVSPSPTVGPIATDPPVIPDPTGPTIHPTVRAILLVLLALALIGVVVVFEWRRKQRGA